MIPEQILEVREYCEEGYMPLIDYGAWRVAILNHVDEDKLLTFNEFFAHLETDEVFVLLKGEAILFTATGDKNIDHIYATDLVKHKAYNVKKGVWHHHILSEDASVLIVENKDTCDANGDSYVMSQKQIDNIREEVRRLWNK